MSLSSDRPWPIVRCSSCNAVLLLHEYFRIVGPVQERSSKVMCEGCYQKTQPSTDDATGHAS